MRAICVEKSVIMTRKGSRMFEGSVCKIELRKVSEELMKFLRKAQGYPWAKRVLCGAPAKLYLRSDGGKALRLSR